MLKRLKPIDPAEVPHKRGEPVLRPNRFDPALLQPIDDMEWKAKPLIKSRTIVSVILTLLTFAAAKFFGLDVDLAAIGVSPAEGLSVGELILLVGAFLAAYFRKIATGPIEGIT